ncbi:MAG: SAM-dependent methyltransferase [Lentimicrobiaceae bacterium]|nr:SAM-dependent methyltransferase [Lentimicrobiaceae bacterium]
MKKQSIIEQLGFKRAVDIDGTQNLSDSQKEIIEQVKGFGLDQVYFSQDEDSSYPAVFIKRVALFDTLTLKQIAKIHKKAWNYKKVSFLYVYNDTEIRIYNCSDTPVFITDNADYEKELKKKELVTYRQSDREQLESLDRIFSSVAIDTGLIWSITEASDIRKKIDLRRSVDQYLVKSLTETAKVLMKEGLENLELIHSLILRSLFLLYLEDRKATDEKFYATIKKDAKSYFDILEDVDSTYLLFEKLEKHFNGNVFSVQKGESKKIKKEHLETIRKCFISGYENTLQTKLFTELRLFDFSIIQIELLSQIYENFLASIDPERKSASGAYYTPPSLVELILNEKLPVNSEEQQYNFKILDPACGSGVFLVESFKRLVRRYENYHKKKLTDFETLKNILVENIYGIDCDSSAIKVTAFSLYLALVDSLDPKTLWQNRKLPNLINDPDDKMLKGQGKNLYKRDTIQRNKEVESIAFDLVVGNPPFGTSNLLDSIRSYCDQRLFAKEKVLPFLHKAIQFAPKGEIAMIFNTKVLTNTGTTYQNFRKWLMEECYVEKIYNFSILRKAPKGFGGQLFGDAVGPISIVFYKKEKPTNPNHRIVYYAPRTYVKSNVLEGIVIDSTDVKYLPREECEKPDTKIWKIAMWGGMNDWELIRKLNNSYSTIQSLFEKENIYYGVGFETSNPANKPNSDIKKMPIHTPNNISRYYTPKPDKRIDADKFRRLGKMEAYKTSHIIINEGIKVDNNRLTLLASFVDYKSAYSKGIVGVYSKNDDTDLLKILTIYFNSDLVRYYAFLTTSSWGIERDVVKHNELFEAPFILDQLNKKQRKELVEIFNSKLIDTNPFQSNRGVESKLNQLISGRLSINDQYSVQHLLDNIDLFHKQEKSNALRPALQDQMAKYGEVVCKDLNDFLEGQNIFASATVFERDIHNPLCLVKISFDKKKKQVTTSKERISKELKKIDNYLWSKKSGSIYFRKKLNYYDGDDIFIIRPNQRRFWSQSMAMEDASELILEILNTEE